MSTLTGTPARLRERLDAIPLTRYTATEWQREYAAAVLDLAHQMTRPTGADILHRLADEITRGGSR